MSAGRIYEELAAAFAAEDVATQFCLIGEGNMHWTSTMETVHGVKTINVRHEHVAVCAAMGYHSATGEVGVASVTCGPGFTQTTTALTSAVRADVPLVMFVGESPIAASWHLQMIDQAPFATACGARYIAVHEPGRLHKYVREAFYHAKSERAPVVLGVPYDLQRWPAPKLGPYEPSSTLMMVAPPLPPNPAQIEAAAGLLAKARCPILVAGRGAMAADAAAAIEELAEASRAVLSTTLPARGLFDHNPHSLGICGGYTHQAAVPVFDRCDLVIAFGASLSYHTLAGGKRFPNATVVQVDTDPRGLRHGLKTADMHIKADARLAALALKDAFAAKGVCTADVRSEELSQRVQTYSVDPTEYDIEPGTLDPRKVFDRLQDILPKHYDMVSGNGHQAEFHIMMRGFDPARYHHMRSFGAIGNSLGYAIGVATARGDAPVVLFEGDGSLMMHIQELETIKRHGLKLLVICMNDGAYGSEIHKLRADNVSDRNAVFGRPDFEEIGKAFGLGGATVTDVDGIETLIRDFEEQEGATIWNVPISDRVLSPSMKEDVKLWSTQ